MDDKVYMNYYKIFEFRLFRFKSWLCFRLWENLYQLHFFNLQDVDDKGMDDSYDDDGDVTMVMIVPQDFVIIK
jgi:hypothetical protein